MCLLVKRYGHQSPHRHIPLLGARSHPGRSRTCGITPMITPRTCGITPMITPRTSQDVRDHTHDMPDHIQGEPDHTKECQIPERLGVVQINLTPASSPVIDSSSSSSSSSSSVFIVLCKPSVMLYSICHVLLWTQNIIYEHKQLRSFLRRTTHDAYPPVSTVTASGNVSCVMWDLYPCYLRTSRWSLPVPVQDGLFHFHSSSSLTTGRRSLPVIFQPQWKMVFSSHLPVGLHRLHYITLELFIVAKVCITARTTMATKLISCKTMSGYGCRNKWVFTFRRNVASDGADWTSSGRLFQSRGPAMANERSPTVTHRDERTSRQMSTAQGRVSQGVDGSLSSPSSSSPFLAWTVKSG